MWMTMTVLVIHSRKQEGQLYFFRFNIWLIQKCNSWRNKLWRAVYKPLIKKKERKKQKKNNQIIEIINIKTNKIDVWGGGNDGGWDIKWECKHFSTKINKER